MKIEARRVALSMVLSMVGFAIQTYAQSVKAKMESLNWLQVGDGYKMLAPIPNGDNFLLVGNDNAIYRKGYGRGALTKITTASGPVSQIVSTQGNVQIGFDFVYATNGGSALYGFAGNKPYDIKPLNMKGNVSALCYDSDQGLFCGTDQGWVYRYVNEKSVSSVGSPAQGWSWRGWDLGRKDHYVSKIIYNDQVGLFVSGAPGSVDYCRAVKKSDGEFAWGQVLSDYTFGPGGGYKRFYRRPTSVMASCGSNGVVVLMLTGNRDMAHPKIPYLFQYLPGINNNLLKITDQVGPWANHGDNEEKIKASVSCVNKNSELLYLDDKVWLCKDPWTDIAGGDGTPSISYDFATKKTKKHKNLTCRQFCVVDTLGTIYSINNEGNLYRSQPMGNDLSIDVKYVSQAAGDQHRNDAVYKISITGAGLTRDQIFKEGLNGFRYKISSSSNKYETYAYPINGVRYIDTPLENQAGMAALNPRTITFQWLGPRSGKVTVEQQMNGKPFGEPVTVRLPPDKSINFPERLPLVIEKETGVAAVNTGTCAIPFSVQLQDEANNPLPDTSELYNRLVFYGGQGGSIDTDKLIGADPLQDDLSILPSDCVELDGHVKYGTCDPRRNTAKHGRHFYLFITGDVERSVFPAIVMNNGEIITARTSLAQTPSTDKLSSSPVNLDGAFGAGPITLFHLLERGSQVACSNISQNTNQNGTYHGYLDFVLRDQGVFYLFPQGLSVANLAARLNPAALSLGFYCAPINQYQKNPFWADTYQVGTYTGLVEATRNKNLHLIVFDRYGRTLNEAKHSGDGVIAVDRIPSYVTNGTPLPIIMASQMTPFNTSDQYEKKTVMGKGYSGVPAPPSGLFMPPNMSEFTTYHTDAPEILEPPFDDTRVRISFQVNTILKKNHSLCDSAFMEIWDVPKMEARCVWTAANIWYRNYASVVLGVKVESEAAKHVRLRGISFACLPNREVGRYNRFSFLVGSSLHTSAGDCVGRRPWVFNEGYEFKTHRHALNLKNEYQIDRLNSFWVIGEVHEFPTIPINPDIKSALGR